MSDKPNKPDKPDARERFAELLGTDSKNFLGTGLTMNEFMLLHRAEQLTASELAIESVIEGDWKMVKEWADQFTFDEEGDPMRETYTPVFATFRELLLQTLRTDKEPPA